MVTGVSVPYLRTPTAPTADRPLLVTMAPASAGRSYFLRSGSSSGFRFSGAGGFLVSAIFGVLARASTTMLRAHAPIVAVVMARFLSFRRSFLPPLLLA